MTLAAPGTEGPRKDTGDRSGGLIPALDQAGLQSATEWSAKAFVLLGGVAAFFGVKDGAVARVVREAPLQTVGIFALLGVGLVLALLAPAVVETWKINIGWVVAALTVVWFVTSWTAVDLAAGEFVPGWGGLALPVAVGAIVGLVLFIQNKRKKLRVKDLAWKAAAIVVAVACVAGGLYAATKLFVQDSVRQVATPVVASVQQAEGATTVTVTMTPVSLGEPVLVIAYLTDPPGGRFDLMNHVLPAESASAPVTVTTEIPDGDWNSVHVARCAGFSSEQVMCVPKEVTTLALPTRFPTLGGTLVDDPDKKVVTVAVTGAQPAYAVAKVTVVGPSGAVLASARLTTGPAGAMQWQSSVPAAAAGMPVQLVAQLCDTRLMPEVCQAAVPVAALTTGAR